MWGFRADFSHGNEIRAASAAHDRFRDGVGFAVRD